ncbi:NUDIX domain-containing protein [bacterium]|nr:NUDIX domain-containing protein [bacterium]
MSQKYEIFYGDKAFIISETTDNPYDNFIVFPIEAHEYDGVEDYFNLLEEHAHKSGVVFISEKPTDMLNRFAADFKEVKAAGGLVVNNRGEILLIKRRGVWDLPKGKVEKGEFLRQAAVREVKEECGVSKLKINSPIKPTFHIYEQDDTLILKTTYWYLMECADPQNVKPQTEEDIEEVLWVNRRELQPYLQNSFSNIKILLALFASQEKDYGNS